MVLAWIGAAVVEVQRAQAAQLLAAAGAPGAAVQRLRHHVAVAGVQRGDVRADHVHAAVQGREFERRRPVPAIAAVQRATSEPWPRAISCCAWWRHRDRARASPPARTPRCRGCDRWHRCRRRCACPAASGRRSRRSRHRHPPACAGAVVQRLGLGLQLGEALAHRALSCARLTSAPMRTASLRGLPTLVLASRAEIASAAAPYSASGTKMRRMAVHFWPDFCVISRATSLASSSKASLPGATPSSSSALLTLSASMLTRTGTLRHRGVRADQRGGVGRAGEGDDVEGLSASIRPGRAAAHHRQRARGQHAGLRPRRPPCAASAGRWRWRASPPPARRRAAPARPSPTGPSPGS